MHSNNYEFSLQHITSKKAKELPMSGRVAVFPIGSNEQHGPHLPIGTDTFILESVIRGVSVQLNQDDTFLLLPVLPYGKSPEHLEFEGTISLKATTLIAVLDDIVNSLHTHGVRKIVFLNSHGGNTSLLSAIAHDFRYSYKVFVYCLNLWSDDFLSNIEIEGIIPKLEYPDVHAASVETSLLLYLMPDYVSDIPHEFKPKATFPTITTGWITSDLSENGVIGDPREGSAEKGKILFELLVKKTLSKLRKIANE